MIIDELFEAPQQCPECGGISFSNLILAEKKDACYHKVKASAKVWPSAYASGRLVQCRKKGAANYGNKSEGVTEGMSGQVVFSGTGDNGGKYEIIQSGPNDFMIHANGRHIDSYDSLHRAMSVLKNEVPGLTKGVAENTAPQLSVQQLATISDAALDQAYGYGRSTPGNTFGWQANLKSAAYAKQMIDQGVTNIEAISDAIHKGWNTTAQAFVQDPEQFDDTAKLAAAGKLEAKLQQRAQLMKQNYGQLPEEEKEKDRVVARALLQAIRGTQQQGVAEGVMSGAEELNIGDPVVITGNVEFEGTTGEIAEFGRDKRFVVVDLYNHGQHSFHSSDVSFNEYAGSNDEEARMYDAGEFGDDPRDDLGEGEQQKGADYRDPKEVDYDDEYDAMVARVKRLAGLGPMRTVYDPAKRVYRNMPTAQQPKK